MQGTEDEEALIARILAGVRAAGGSTSGEHVLVGPGDDCASLRPPPGQDLVWTTDDQVEGAHFERAWARARGFQAIGAKAAGASLSDLAAAGARPLGALLSLGLPADLGLEALDGLARGLGRKLAAAGCPLVGGNLVRQPERLTLNVSALGLVPAGRAFSRAGGRAGDALYVSGPLGWARLGLAALSDPGADLADPRLAPALDRLLDPQPRIALGLALQARGARLACMDLSDGLARDLPRLARASGLAGEVEAAALPAPDPELARRLGHEPARLAWLGGEDYELLVAGPPGLEDLGLVRIGSLVAGPPGAVRLDGRPVGQPEARLDWGEGFDHFA